MAGCARMRPPQRVPLPRLCTPHTFALPRLRPPNPHSNHQRSPAHRYRTMQPHSLELHRTEARPRSLAFSSLWSLWSLFAAATTTPTTHTRTSPPMMSTAAAGAASPHTPPVRRGVDLDPAPAAPSFMYKLTHQPLMHPRQKLCDLSLSLRHTQRRLSSLSPRLTRRRKHNNAVVASSL
jgi:hypothetical protein